VIQLPPSEKVPEFVSAPTARQRLYEKIIRRIKTTLMGNILFQFDFVITTFSGKKCQTDVIGYEHFSDFVWEQERYLPFPA
jgi:hypothetical protein